ncbi:hypothetical protein [Albimonas pacifica]|uniref:Holin-X, holin superfamily III n=1 Tax=Albimonas pacifica TaxID=1114924 RepID=A0A1I3D685_9RHOB|nr:hypothetical protein [Albimonas pacifica]SFH82243.1 hypothetical protein SAMN05216258_102411 [Albimonas pacifica]
MTAAAPHPVSAHPASGLPAAPGGALGAIVLACLAGAAIGGGVAVAGHGLLAAFVAAWLSAIVGTVAIPALGLMLRRAPARAAVPADLDAWDADLRQELEAVRASRRVA